MFWLDTTALVCFLFFSLLYRLVLSRILLTFQASLTWTCWRYQSVSCLMTSGTCGSVHASQTAASMWEGRSSKPTNPSLQVRPPWPPQLKFVTTQRKALKMGQDRHICATSERASVESYKYLERLRAVCVHGLICSGLLLQWVLIHTTTPAWPCLTQMTVRFRRLRGWLCSLVHLH